jgi:hypothetical protein
VNSDPAARWYYYASVSLNKNKRTLAMFHTSFNTVLMIHLHCRDDADDVHDEASQHHVCQGNIDNVRFFI